MADRVVAVHYRLDDTPHCQTASLYATLDSSTAYQASAVERTVPIRGARAREGRLLLTVPSHLRSRPNFVTLLPVAQSGRRGEVARVLISGT